MMIIDHHTGRYAPINTGNVGPNRPTSIANSQPKARPAADVTVVLSGSSTSIRTSAATYSNPAQQRQTPESVFSDTIRELAPTGTHPKALFASKTFLDIAHFDGDSRLVDVYA